MREYKLVNFRGTWCVSWREATGTRRASLRTADRGIAEQRFQDYIKATKTPAGTVAEIWSAYCKEKEGTASAGGFKHRWKKLGPHFGNLRPDQITRIVCKSYIALRRKAGASNNTILRELGNLKSAVRWHNPQTPAVFEMPPAGGPRERFLTREEYKALLNGAQAPHIRLFIIMALNTAARSTALLQLTWDRVDFERGLIVLATGEHGMKGRATVKMNDHLKNALTAAYQVRGLSNFVIEHGGARVGSVKKGFAAAVTRAKLEDVSPHVLRHTAAVWLAEAGWPMSAIAKMLGHKDSRITERVYAKFSPDYMKNMVEALAI